MEASASSDGGRRGRSDETMVGGRLPGREGGGLQEDLRTRLTLDEQRLARKISCSLAQGRGGIDRTKPGSNGFGKGNSERGHQHDNTTGM